MTLAVGNGPAAYAAATELPRVELADALALTLLLSDQRERFERAGVRWVAGSPSRCPVCPWRVHTSPWRNIGLVESNPSSNLRLAATERKPDINPPTLEQFRALTESCTTLGGYGREMRAMIEFAGWTGLRQGELFGLQWHDVGEDEITVRRARKLDGTLGLPKNGMVRTVPILRPAQVLEVVPRRPDEFVFHTPRGKPLTKGTHAWSWQKVKSRAGVEVRWHDLRHFCATQLLELGLDHFAVSVQLGHTDGGALVMERYGHPSVDAAKQRLLRGLHRR